MSKKIKKTRLYKGLDNFSVYKEDTDNSIFHVFSIPDILPKGKSHFLIYGSDLLKQETELNIEILDSVGNVVYTEIPFYLESNSRAVSIWVYSDDIEPGLGKITILGELKDPPKEWKNYYNVKWTKEILIDPNLDNTLPIKFVSHPKYTIKEIFKFNKNFDPTSLDPIIFNSGSISATREGSLKNGLYWSKAVSEIPDPLDSDDRVYVNLSGSTFTYNLVGGTVYVDSPDYVFPFSASWDLNTPYTGTIKYLNNFAEAIVSPDPYVQSKANDLYYPVNFNNSSYRIEYMKQVTGSKSQQSSSFFEIDFNNLTTFSGKVETAKVWKLSKTNFDQYTYMGDFSLDSNNMLVGENNTLLNPIGEFYNLEDIQSNWVTESFDNNYPNPDYEYNTTHVFGSVKLYNSKNYKFYPNLSMSFRKNNNYLISARIATKISASEDSKLEIYASGSAFIDINSGNLGKIVTTLTASTDTLYEYQKFMFSADTEASGNVSFVVRSGEWYLSDIYVYPFNDDGFNPDSTKIYIPNLSQKRNEAVSFFIQYLNSNGQIASVKNQLPTDAIFVSGSPTFIEGEYNVLSGSLIVGNPEHGGIEIAGLTDAFIRSIGYTGFYDAENFGHAGFIIYSGSILTESNDTYSGVGLELHAGYQSGSLKFIANSTESYLRISGSIYATDGYFSGILSASEGNIGGWTIGTSSLYNNDGVGKIVGIGVSGSSNNSPRFWAGATDLTYDAASSASFNVKSGGDITGSKVLFTGGKIGGFTITDTQITSSNLIIDSNGSLYTNDYESNNKGWIITSALNGYAEFENAKIRGTLSTVVFEKETINAVGGQLWIANSTTLSESVSATDTIWSVKNASSFDVNEILLIKTINNIGFSTEYVLVTSSSINNTDTGAGNLYVQRGYANGTTVPSPNLPYIDFSASPAFPYSASQVIVSTGKLNSGYIRINANPRDITTPYIDIIERTGSGIYDLDLMDRSGDLSGLSPSLLYGDTNPGFGIYTKNGYFSGAVTARTGSFTGIVHVGNFNFGLNVSGSNDGIYLNTNNYWYDDSYFKIGDNTNYLEYDIINGLSVKGDGSVLDISSNATITTIQGDIVTNSSSISINSTNIGLNVSSITANSNSIVSNKSSIDINSSSISLNVSSITANSNSIVVNSSSIALNSGSINLKVSKNDVINQINISTEGIKIDADNIKIDGTTTFSPGYDPTSKAKVYRQTTAPTSGMFTGDIWIDTDDGNRPYTYDGANWVEALTIISGNNITTGNITSNNYSYISGNFSTAGTQLNLTYGLIRSKNFAIDSSGNAYLSGSISANYGDIGGFSITSTKLYTNNSGIYTGLQSGGTTTKSFFAGASDNSGTGAKTYLAADGSGIFADGNIKWDTAGNIAFASGSVFTSGSRLPELTRIFGNGDFGGVQIDTGINYYNNKYGVNGDYTPTKVAKTSGATEIYYKETGTFYIQYISGSTWKLRKDIYMKYLTISSGVTLQTNGYRIFVSNTLVNNGIISNDAVDGIGAAGGTLASGSNGAGA